MKEKEVARILLDIKAVELRPSQPFQWSSGILAPIYCDNRLLMSFVNERRRIIDLMAEKVITEIGLENFDIVCGTASSGIPHAAWLAEKLNKPMIYIRKKGKGYGMDKLVEGKLEHGQRVLLVEDLISTGGSALRGVEGVRYNGGICNHCIAIFTYEMDQSKKGFPEAKCNLSTLTNFSTLVRVAVENGFIKDEEMQPALDWSKDPENWMKNMGPRVEKNKIELTEKEQLARKKLCLPLDGLYSLDEIKARVEELSPYIGMFKVGKESFNRFGPEAIRLVKSYGVDVFYDSKFHDIPNTVKGASMATAEMGVAMFNIHASGGLEMMQDAIKGARMGAEKSGHKMPKVLGMTILTSLNQQIVNEQLRIPGTVEEQVLHLAKLSQQAGCDGIVCSAAEVALLKEHFPVNFMFVTPGIKGPNTPAGYDQKRVFTPGVALQNGSTILVAGRTITAHPTTAERKRAAYEVLQDMAKIL